MDKVFFSDYKELDEYLKHWKNGTFEMGKTTGMPDLDKHFRFKEGQLNIFGGIDNVGKSTVIWYLMLLSAVLHDWKWIMYCAENTTNEIVKKLIEFYEFKPLDKMNEKQIKYAKQFVLEHFKFIETEGLPTYKEILTHVMQFDEFNGLLIDPWNAMTEASSGNKHDDDYAAIKHLKQYTKEFNKCVYINTHVTTSAARIDKESLQIPAPKKADIEGGNKFANKADDVVMIHRHVYDKDKWMETELHVAKVKRTETGGRVTPFSSPVVLRSLPGLTGFECNGVNPIFDRNAKQYDVNNFPKLDLKEEEEPF